MHSHAECVALRCGTESDHTYEALYSGAARRGGLDRWSSGRGRVWRRRRVGENNTSASTVVYVFGMYDPVEHGD